MITSASVPGGQIQRQDLAAIFLGTRTKWSDGTPIKPVDHSVGSSLRKAFSKRVLERSMLAVQNYWFQEISSGRRLPPPVKSTDEEVIAFVAAGPGRIGYVSLGHTLPGAIRTLTVVD